MAIHKNIMALIKGNRLFFGKDQDEREIKNKEIYEEDNDVKGNWSDILYTFTNSSI